jgi:hypothetical protein
MTEAQSKAVDSLRPEAKEFVEKIMNDKLKTTKDNYGRVLAFLSSFNKAESMFFLAAMIREGYPKETAIQISQML